MSKLSFRGLRLALAVSILLVGGSALAQYESYGYGRGQGWSVLSGETVGQGHDVITGQVGWPGVDFSYLHGVAPNLDFGGKFTFNYGEEGIVNATVPGVKLQLQARVGLLETSHLKFGIEFDPGLLFYFYGANLCDRFGCYYAGNTEIGVTLPLQFNFGVPVGSAIMTNFGVWLPMWVDVGTGGGFVLPVLFGGGLEYFVSSKLAFSFNLHLGPAIDTASGYAYFALDAMFGFSYRL